MKINLLKKILKGSMDVFILKMFGAVAVFILTLSISNSAGPAALGKFQLLSKLVLIGSIFATLGLEIFSVRKISEVGENQILAKRFVKNSTLVILIVSLFTALVIFLFRVFIAEKFFKSNDSEIFIVLAGTTIFFYSGYSFLCQILRGYGSVKAFAFFRYSWLHVFFLAMLGILFIFKRDLPEEYIYILYFAGIVISFAAIFLYLRRYLEKREYKGSQDVKDDPGIKDDIIRSLPMMLSSSLSFLTSYSSIFIIGYFLSTYYVGIFSGIQQFMMFFTFVSVALSAYTSPLLAKSHINKDLKLLRSLYLHSILTGAVLLVPFFIAFTFFPSLVLQITFGDKYVFHSNVMTILSIGFFVNALSGPAISMMNMTDNQAKLVWFSLFNVLFSSVLTAVLTWKFDLTGAAVASCLTNIVFRMFLFYYITKFIATDKKVSVPVHDS